MAILTEPQSSGFETGELAPSGTFAAVCEDIKDEFGVQRKQYLSETYETMDITRFLFSFTGHDGKPYKIQTKEFRISGHPKASLFKFLQCWLGKAPAYNWDYMELKGSPALITIEHRTSNMGKTYAQIINISPIPHGMNVPQPVQSQPAQYSEDNNSDPIPF